MRLEVAGPGVRAVEVVVVVVCRGKGWRIKWKSYRESKTPGTLS